MTTFSGADTYRAAVEPARSGRVPVDGHEVAWWEWGAGEEVVLGLHGGPGLDHRYIQRVADVAGPDRRVVLFDQLGGGQSDRPDDPSLWTVERFVGEVRQVREALGLERVHLYGQSWGGWLALQCALDGAPGIETLVLSNTSASIAETFKGMVLRRTALPAADYATLMRCEGEGRLDDPEYVAIVDRLYATHLRRSTPYEPERSLREYYEVAEPLLAGIGPAFETMWGPHEFLCDGNLTSWDVTDRLGEIAVPTLILSALHDHLGIELQTAMAQRIPDNELIIFGNSSHLTMLEREADAYVGAIASFLDRHPFGAAR